MKLLFCHDGPMSVDKYGNAYPRIFTNEVLKRYYSIADKMTFFTRTKLIDYNQIDVPKADMEKLKIVSSPNLSSIKGIFISRKKAKKRLYDEIEKNDFLIVRLPGQIGVLAIDIARKLKKPYLIELVGCPWDSLWNHSIKGKLVAPFVYKSTKKIIKNADYVLYVSNKFLQRRYPSKMKTLACSDVNLQTLNEKLLESRLDKINSMSSKNPTILGTIAPVDVRYKGQKYVIEAISNLNKEGYNFEYHLVGGGDNTYLKTVAKRHNVLDKVKFLGSLSHDKVFKFTEYIDIYVQPSNAESHGRVILEAMSTACPVIGSSTGGIPELVSQDFVFKRKDINNLEEKLIKMDMETMITEAKRNFNMAKKFDKKILNKKRIEFYNSFKEGINNHD